MNKKIIASILILYIGLSILTYGIALADFQNIPKYDREWASKKYCSMDIMMAAMFGIFSPVSFMGVFILSGFAEHGIQFTCGIKDN